MPVTVLILNGPGLADLSDYADMLGSDVRLDDIRNDCALACEDLGLTMDFRQTDDQEEMFRWIAKDSEAFDGVIINPVGYSRSALVTFELYRSAIKMIANLKKPVIEVHIKNIYRQIEEITQRLHEPEGDMGFISGFGRRSYTLAIQAIARKLENRVTGQ